MSGNIKAAVDALIYVLYRLATHEDVRLSYPSLDAPGVFQNDEEKAQWWTTSFEGQVGLLHKVKWHRIVVDGKIHQSLCLCQILHTEYL